MMGLDGHTATAQGESTCTQVALVKRKQTFTVHGTKLSWKECTATEYRAHTADLGQSNCTVLSAVVVLTCHDNLLFEVPEVPDHKRSWYLLAVRSDSNALTEIRDD